MGNSVTINISNGATKNPMFKEGDMIRVGKNFLFIPRQQQRIKNEKMVHRLLKKEYYPYLIVMGVDENSEEITLILKPFNF